MVVVHTPSMRSIDEVLDALKRERNTFAADRVMDCAAEVIKAQRDEIKKLKCALLAKE